MSVFENLSDVRKMTFNGIKPRKVIFNGVDILRDSSEVFKDGVLNEDCTLSGAFENLSDCLYMKVVTRENNGHEIAGGSIGIDVTEYSKIIVSGEYFAYYGMDEDGSASIMYGFSGDRETLFNQTPEADVFTLEIDISDRSGVNNFDITCIIHGGKNIAETYDQCYIQCYVYEIRLE